MPKDRWAAFVDDVQSVVAAHAASIYSRALGLGYWDGLTEETFVISFVDDSVGLDRDLSALAFQYEQESIALVRGRCFLVPASSGMASTA